ncbi:xyloglucan endotransglucosylase/hydrolase protein 10 [Pyrus ussuriensis x Pyrus communis]|uniref:Xyloglucan endotransglucosylase/hydrolase protein 10 n=1 Tax=Pyrus ussuriensis x Pyrus communis TaxID=2448454 RepID=A0A5N5IA24_9ROSA|nr:xyloglucan endotransglucosylase/hydrolase protein 10 [Pyrus ussuriensis x Pyrus communis]
MGKIWCTFAACRFIADWVPIRVYRNHADKGVAFPMWQPMNIKASLWNGNSWATRGGRDKIDWSKGPFTASLRNHKIDACVWKGNARFCRAESLTNRWNKERFILGEVRDFLEVISEANE